MMARWRKLGLLYSPESSAQPRHPKLLSHAANPLPIHLAGDVFRVFYDGRDSQNRSSVGGVDIDIVQRRIVCDHPLPFMESGAEGSYYKDGISIGNDYWIGDKRYILFMAWQTPPDQHWFGQIGRIEVLDGLSLRPDGDRPFMILDETDPISLSYPAVIASATGGYEMWYGSTLTWAAENGTMVHILKQATSVDGNRWIKSGDSIPYQIGTDQAKSRPTLLRDGDGLHCWFSYRGVPPQKYRIGYAVKVADEPWQLALNRSGITVSESGWDSEMIEYPFVFEHRGDRYLLYNGNGYGKTGFGLAIWE
ncbi:MAG: hypothetical protein QM523_03695 [Candidatus Pacebacteria bacterium]|nr:hypothetical protein [Candidatus Paceibacterota bacterium]